MKVHDQPPSNMASLEKRLHNLCDAEELVFGRTQRHVAVAVAGQFISMVDGTAIKGASNLEARLGTDETRVSRDLDAVSVGPRDAFEEGLRERLADGWAGFTGTLAFVREIAAPVPPGYAPHEYKLSLHYKGRPFTSLKFEVSSEEIGALADLDGVVPEQAAEWMASLGLPRPKAIPMLRLDHQIAQKLHACTIPDGDRWTNDRVRDLVDLQLAERINEHPLSQIRTTAKRLFRARQRHEWPPLVTPRTGWRERYPEDAADLDVLPTLEAAIDWCNDFIRQIDNAE